MLGPEVNTMYSRILFAVDDDDSLAGATPVVAAYARRWRSGIHVLHVHRIDPDVSSRPGRDLVDQLVKELLSEGVSADGEVLLVQAAENVAGAVARIARREAADLVAIGSRGRTDLGALFLGSVSHAVARGLDVPVLVLRAGCPSAAEPGPVLVAVDGSSASDRALAEAGEVAESFGASVVVLHVRQVTGAEGVAVVEPADEARVIVDRGLAALQQRGIRTTEEVVVDHSVADAIARAAERQAASLVVLGSRRPSSVGGLLLGSVAHEAIHLLRRPVLLAGRVREGQAVANRERS
jgi:nucleotide-binding universal stress UspA family protein